MNVNMKTPCPQCPFRTDLDGGAYLTRGRVVEIMEGVERGGSFACHKTVTHDEETGEHVPSSEEQICAGSMLLLEHQHRGPGVGGEGPGMRANQSIRHAFRFAGMFAGENEKTPDPDNMDFQAPVYRSWRSMIAAQKR